MKKQFSLLLALVLMFSMVLSVSASAASWPSLGMYSYCEFVAPKTINVYNSMYLTTRGTSSPAKRYNAYIDKGVSKTNHTASWSLLFPLRGSITRSSSVKTAGYYCDYKTGGSVPVYAPANGTVVYKQAYRNTNQGKMLSSYGNFIEFTSNDGVYRVKCCHLSSFYGVTATVKKSLVYKCSGSDGTLTLKTKRVKQGELLGYSGMTGNASGHHLHLEVTKNGRAVNPTSVFKTW